MNTKRFSFTEITAAFAVAFVFLTLPLTASAFVNDLFDNLDIPSFDDIESSITYTQITCNIKVDSDVIYSGESVTVTWETEGLDTIEINGETVSGDSGSKTYTNITENTIFKLVATNNSGSTCNATVSVTCLPPVAEPECTLHANPDEVKHGETTTLTWTTKNADTVHLSGTNLTERSVAENDNFTTAPLTQKSWYMITAKTADGKEAVCKTDVDYEPKTPTPPECPIDPAPGRIIIDFGDKRIYSNRGFDASQTALQSFAVPAGKYDIRLVSYDGYLNRVNATQLFEQYQLQFVKDGTEVARSSAISDLADKVVEATNDEVVNTSFELVTNATGLRAVHAFYGDNSSANSLNPICASLDPVEPELPKCDFFEASPTEITPGGEVTLTWETTNADQVFINNGIGNVAVDGSTTVKPLTDTTYVLTAIGAKDAVVDCYVKVEVDDEPKRPECPFHPASDGRLIFEFDDRIYSSRGLAASQTDTITVNVPAATYDIYLASWDGYSNRVNVSQPNEEWQLEFLSNGNQVGLSNAISDVPDFVAQAFVQEKVNDNYVLSSAADAVRGVHAVYPDNTSANSVNPICAKIIPEEPEPELPSCDLFTADKTKVGAGAEVTLTWETTNATQVFINNGVGTVAVDGSTIVKPTTDTTYVLTAIGVKDKVVDCQVRVEVEKDPEKPQCPFTPLPNRTIINFDDRIRSDQSLGSSRTDEKAVSLEAGTYDIFLAAWDGYANRITANQPNERYQLEFLSADAQVGLSDSTTDLDDNVVQAFLQEQVNDDYVLTAAADEVRGVHTVYPDNTSANSLNPICAAVDKIEIPEPSCDLFTASPSTITVGDSTTLTWETTNATDVSINNGVGSVVEDGSVIVSPTTDTTYVLTVTGVNNQSVDCEVPVKVSEDEVPVCKVFTATPTQLGLGGGDVTLTWEIEKATSVSISPTIGTVGLSGSTTTNVTQSTTYTLTAVDANGDKVTCQALVVVPDPTPFTCEGNVTFAATPDTVRRGNDVTLTWNVTDADSVSISGINATTLSGSETITPNETTTYVLTATRGNETIECPVPVTVTTGGGGGSSSPRCELEISDERISLGEEITLTWETSRTNDITITDDLGNVIVTTEGVFGDDKDDLLDGSITLTPTRDTKYTLVAERGSRDRECDVEVEIENDIVILETRDQLPLVAGISLTSVPHTGFEAGPFMTLMFYALLVAWAFYIAYLVVARKRAVETVKVARSESIMQRAEDARPDVFVQSVAPVAETHVPTNLPTADTAPTIGYESATTEVSESTVASLENRAHSQKALLSSDAIQYFVETTDGSVERDSALDTVIAEAKKNYPLEDGWIVVNESRMRNLCDVCKVNAEAAPAGFVEKSTPEGSSSLAEAIVTGNVVAAYEMIGNRPMFALADAAADLDAVYRTRQGEDKIVSDLLSSETETLSDEQIKSMISALTSALDGTYTDEASAVKMAIMKAVKEVA